MTNMYIYGKITLCIEMSYNIFLRGVGPLVSIGILQSEPYLLASFCSELAGKYRTCPFHTRSISFFSSV